MATTPRFRTIGPMNWSQQVLHKILSVITEPGLIAILRAVRHHPSRPLLVDAINAELDKGTSLMAFFSDNGYAERVLKENLFIMEVAWAEDGEQHCDFKFGMTGDDEEGAVWGIKIDAQGKVHVEEEALIVWSPEDPL